MYIVGCSKQGICALVDPVNPEKALSELSVVAPNWKLTHVLTTHHHWDHAGGNKKFHELRPEVEILGGDSRVDAVSKIVENDFSFSLGSLNVKCIATPCHTSGHICYLVSDEHDKAVFTGDTLFIAGCGKFFEGTPQQMHTALIGKLAALDKQTKVYCGHEYTVSNLKFAKHVEPDNQDIAKKLDWATKIRASGQFTVPSTIGEELLTNPFMRVNEQPVQRHTSCDDPVAVMGKLREEKNAFKAA